MVRIRKLPTSTNVALFKPALAASLTMACILSAMSMLQYRWFFLKHSQTHDLWMAQHLFFRSTPDRRRPHPEGPTPNLTKNHRIYRGWEQPIVFPEFNFVFFPVPKAGSTTFDQLFLRMIGHPDWNRGRDHQKIHDLAREALRGRLLGSMNLDRAQEVMTSPNWTRAIFVREPKERLLSAYLHKVVASRGFYGAEICCRKHVGGPIGDMSAASISDMAGAFEHCSPQRSVREIIATKRTCDRWLEIPLNLCAHKLSTLDGFVELTRTDPDCSDPHWSHQSARVDDDFWDYINFVGYMDTAGSDAKQLLHALGHDLWNKFGATGWGKDGKESFFEGVTDLNHKTGSRSQYKRFYTLELEKKVNAWYARDFNNTVLQLNRYIDL